MLPQPNVPFTALEQSQHVDMPCTQIVRACVRAPQSPHAAPGRTSAGVYEPGQHAGHDTVPYDAEYVLRGHVKQYDWPYELAYRPTSHAEHTLEPMTDE